MSDGFSTRATQYRVSQIAYQRHRTQIELGNIRSDTPIVQQNGVGSAAHGAVAFRTRSLSTVLSIYSPPAIANPAIVAGKNSRDAEFRPAVVSVPSADNLNLRHVESNTIAAPAAAILSSSRPSLQDSPILNQRPALRDIWVSAHGNDSNDGSKQTPLASIQAAVNAATPGTTVRVGAGTYHENVRIKQNGTDEAPISIVSADGPGAATVVPLDQNVATFLGRGAENVAIIDFRIDGADNRAAIEFTQAGHDFSRLGRNIVIRGNEIYDVGRDGIKIAQAGNVEITGNKVLGGKEEGIDLVTVWDSRINRNEVSGVSGLSGITVKGGSTNVELKSNYVHDVATDGILVGGWTDSNLFHIYKGYEAKNIIIEQNLVERVGKRALNFIGAQDATAVNNDLRADNEYSTVVNIEGDPINNFSSRNIVLLDNRVDKSDWLQVGPGQGLGLIKDNNEIDTAWLDTGSKYTLTDPGEIVPAEKPDQEWQTADQIAGKMSASVQDSGNLGRVGPTASIETDLPLSAPRIVFTVDTVSFFELFQEDEEVHDRRIASLPALDYAWRSYDLAVATALPGLRLSV